jgi:hypothetical protein
VNKGRSESQSGGGSQYSDAELDSLIDWIAEVIAEQRLKELQGGSLSTTPSKTQEESRR